MSSYRKAAHKGLQSISRTSRSQFGNRLAYYHSVHPTLPRSHSPERFREQLLMMKQMRMTFITQSEISAADGAAPWVAVGFDDGYEDNYTVVLPILEELQVRATFYVVVGAVADETRPAPDGYHLYEGYSMLNHGQIREISQAGHEIASHGWHHELATWVLREGRDLGGELRRSRDRLSDLAGVEVFAHSYPNGQNGAFSRRTVREVANAGFLSSATTIWGPVDRGTSLMSLPRCEMSMFDTTSQVREKLSGVQDYRRLVHRLRRGHTWR